jgi:hypothetical protein
MVISGFGIHRKIMRAGAKTGGGGGVSTKRPCSLAFFPTVKAGPARTSCGMNVVDKELGFGGRVSYIKT